MNYQQQALIVSLYWELKRCTRLLESEVSTFGVVASLNLPSFLEERLRALGTLLSQLGYTPTDSSSHGT